MAVKKYLVALTTMAGLSLASPINTQNTQSEDLYVEPVVRVPGTKFENLAVRSNGNVIMVEAGPKPALYQVDPFGQSPKPVLISSLNNVTLATGIVEMEPDVFYVNGGHNISPGSPKLGPTPPGTGGIYRVDMRTFKTADDGKVSSPAKVEHFSTVEHAGLLNGLTSIGHYLLAADSFTGTVWRIDTRNGVSSLAINHTTMHASHPGRAGINGVKVRGSNLYYDNTETSTLYKMAIDTEGLMVAPPHLLAANISCDDLLLDSEENVYVAGPADIITRVDTMGHQTVLAGTMNSNSSALVGPTALAWGRTPQDEGEMYITANGGAMTLLYNATGLFKMDVSKYL